MAAHVASARAGRALGTWQRSRRQRPGDGDAPDGEPGVEVKRSLSIYVLMCWLATASSSPSSCLIDLLFGTYRACHHRPAREYYIGKEDLIFEHGNYILVGVDTVRHMDDSRIGIVSSMHACRR